MMLCLSQKRNELCRWDPLQLIPGTLKDTPIVNAVSLEGFEWYNTVIDYSDGVRDPDEQLVPTLVKKVVFPRIEHYIKLGSSNAMLSPGVLGFWHVRRCVLSHAPFQK